MNRKQRTQYAFNVKVISRNGCFYHILNAHTQEEAVEKAKKKVMTQHAMPRRDYGSYAVC